MRKSADESMRQAAAESRPTPLTIGESAAKILESVSDVFIAVDSEWRYTYVNHAAERITRLPREQMLGRSIWELFTERSPEFESVCRRALEEGVPAYLEEYYAPLGTWFDVAVYPSADGLAVHARDVTESKRAEKAISERENFLQHVVETTPIMLDVFDMMTGHPSYVNRGVNMNGYTLEELLQMEDPTSALVHPEDMGRMREHGERLRRAADGEVLRIEYRMRHREGGWRWMSGYCMPFSRTEQGEVRQVVSATIDVTNQKRAEGALRRAHGELERRVAERTNQLTIVNEELRREIAERRRTEDDVKRQKEILQKMFDHIPASVCFFNEDGRLAMVNREFERTLGWAFEELLGANSDMFSVCYPEPQDCRRAREFIAAASGEWADFKVRAKDGRVIDMTWANVRLSDRTNIGIGQDITERKRAEEHLRRTRDQLRALTARLRSAREEESIRIAREIHDELGSAMSSLRWGLEAVDAAVAASAGLPQPAALREKLGNMMRLTDITISAVRRIASELRPSVLDNLGLAEAVEWQAQQFQRRTGTLCQYGSSLENLDLNQEQTTAVFRIFQEALTNILRHSGATAVEVSMEKEGDDFVMTVSDNGRGITEDEQSRAQSLGLLGMRERARLIGGRVDIVGTKGKGTVVTVRFPIPADGRSADSN